jgi:mRNA-degrading endonuclease RelE of RelBE toxin-antitoxin system
VTWKIKWTDRALKDAGRLDRQVRARVVRALERFAESGHGDLKQLTSSDREMRLRVGSWRVRLELDYRTATVTVLRVLPRGRAYRD